jgi:hypothetical protein
MSGKAIRETLGVLAVVGGMVMVAVELYQNSKLVEAQLASDEYAAWVEIDASKQGESFAEVLAKAIERPEDLTLAEMVELDGYLYTYLDLPWRRKALHSLGIGEAVPEEVAGTIDDYFGNRFARAWWEETKFKYREEMIEIIEREMQNVSPDQHLEFFGRIGSRLSQGS